MGMFTKIRQWFARKIHVASNLLTQSGYSFTNGSLASNETIFSAITMLSTAIASLPVSLRIGGRKLGPDEHNVARLLKWGPCPNFTTFEFIRTMEVLRDSTGAGYAIKEPDKYGNVAALWLLKTENVSPRIDRESRELYFRIVDDLSFEEVYLHSSAVISVSHISSDGINPINPIQVLRNTLDYDREVKEFSVDQMQNGLRAKVVIKWPSTQLGPEQIDEYNKVIAKFKKSGILYLDKGKELTELSGNSIIDPKVFEVENITIARVARVYNIPLEKFLPEKTSYTSSEQADLNYLRDAVLPIVRMYEEEFTNKLLSIQDREKGVEIKWNMSGFIRADTNTRGDFYQKAIRSGWLNRDEVRALEDYPPIPGGLGQTYLVSRDLTSIEQILKEGDGESV